jgi:uncharacterized protein YycO
MKVIYRYRSDLPCSKDDIIQDLRKQQRQNRPRDWIEAEIKKITNDYEDNDCIVFVDSSYGDISFTAWHHYGIMLDTGEIFADLGDNGVNAIEERQRLKDYFESNSGTEEDYIELDDIVL